MGWLLVCRVFLENSHLIWCIWWALPLWYIRPSVMVAPLFILECITPKCLTHENEGEATPTTTIGILPLQFVDSIWWILPHRYFYGWWWSLPLLLSCITKVYHDKKESKRPHNNSRDSSSMIFRQYMMDTPHRYFDHRWWSLLLSFQSALHENV
jgi:hypothetical protein